MSTTTEQAAHTRGPWEARYHEDEYESKHVILMGEARDGYPGFYNTGEAIEYDHGSLPGEDGFAEAEANALLIAASPDLLAALKGLCDFNPSSADVGEVERRHAFARAAIAAATTYPRGETDARASTTEGA